MTDFRKNTFGAVLALVLLFVQVNLQAQVHGYGAQDVHYKMNIDVDVKKYTYNGYQEIRYTNNSQDELSEIYFHLYWNAFRPGSMMDQRAASQGAEGDGRLQKNGVSRLASIPADQTGYQNIHWIKQNGKNLQYSIQETVMKVILDTPLKPGNSTTFTMEWDSRVPMQIRRAGRNNAEGIDLTMTQWYPKVACYDYDGWATFDYIGREFHAPFADFDVSITIDKSYVIGAGGVLQNPEQVKGYSDTPEPGAARKGKLTWKWKAENILDFAWAADPDYTVESVDILNGPKVYFVYQKSPETAYWEQAKDIIPQFFRIMNANFGEYDYPVYSFVQGGDGGMEYGMCTMILGKARSLEGLCGLMFHEAAHSWYQQMLATNEAMYPWMDEGFTSYAENLAMYEIFKRDKNLPNPFIETILSYQKFIATGKEEPASWLADHHHGGRAYTFASYVKGELFLVNLGYIIGEKKLKEVLSTYYKDWKFKHPDPRDFMHIAQKISGMDLKWFYHYWIQTTDQINYAVKSAEAVPGGLKIILQNKGGVPMPVDLDIVLKSGEILHYAVPVNLTRKTKTEDIYGLLQELPYWPWTQKEYTAVLPLNPSEVKTIAIDLSRRMADADFSDNSLNLN